MEKVETITPFEAAQKIHKNAEFIRAGLRQGIFDFGSAVPPKKQGGRWNYVIIKSKFLKYCGEWKEVIKDDKRTKDILQNRTSSM